MLMGEESQRVAFDNACEEAEQSSTDIVHTPFVVLRFHSARGRRETLVFPFHLSAGGDSLQFEDWELLARLWVLQH